MICKLQEQVCLHLLQKTGEEAFEGDGKDPSLGQPVLSSDEIGVQADPVTSTHLGVGGTDDERVGCRADCDRRT